MTRLSFDAAVFFVYICTNRLYIMKSIIKMMAVITALLFPVTLMSCSDKIIQPSQLPSKAVSFIEQHFPGIEVSYVKLDSGLMKKSYDVRLANGVEIEFNGKGEWDNVDCNNMPVPSVLVPEAIATYVQTIFPGQSIVKIDKEPFGWEVELSSDLELKFSKDGRLLTVDD